MDKVSLDSACTYGKLIRASEIWQANDELKNYVEANIVMESRIVQNKLHEKSVADVGLLAEIHFQGDDEPRGTIESEDGPLDRIDLAPHNWLTETLGRKQVGSHPTSLSALPGAGGDDDKMRTIRRPSDSSGAWHSSPFDDHLMFKGLQGIKTIRLSNGQLRTPAASSNLFLTVPNISEVLEHHTWKYRLYVTSLADPITLWQGVGMRATKQTGSMDQPLLHLLHESTAWLHSNTDIETVLAPIMHDRVRLLWSVDTDHASQYILEKAPTDPGVIQRPQPSSWQDQWELDESITDILIRPWSPQDLVKPLDKIPSACEVQTDLNQVIPSSAVKPKVQAIEDDSRKTPKASCSYLVQDTRSFTSHPSSGLGSEDVDMLKYQTADEGQKADKANLVTSKKPLNPSAQAFESCVRRLTNCPSATLPIQAMPPGQWLLPGSLHLMPTALQAPMAHMLGQRPHTWLDAWPSQPLPPPLSLSPATVLVMKQPMGTRFMTHYKETAGLQPPNKSKESAAGLQPERHSVRRVVANLDQQAFIQQMKGEHGEMCLPAVDAADPVGQPSVIRQQVKICQTAPTLAVPILQQAVQGQQAFLITSRDQKPYLKQVPVQLSSSPMGYSRTGINTLRQSESESLPVAFHSGYCNKSTGIVNKQTSHHAHEFNAELPPFYARGLNVHSQEFIPKQRSQQNIDREANCSGSSVVPQSASNLIRSKPLDPGAQEFLPLASKMSIGLQGNFDDATIKRERNSQKQQPSGSEQCEGDQMCGTIKGIMQQKALANVAQLGGTRCHQVSVDSLMDVAKSNQEQLPCMWRLEQSGISNHLPMAPTSPWGGHLAM